MFCLDEGSGSAGRCDGTFSEHTSAPDMAISSKTDSINVCQIAALACATLSIPPNLNCISQISKTALKSRALKRLQSF